MEQPKLGNDPQPIKLESLSICPLLTKPLVTHIYELMVTNFKIPICDISGAPGKV